MLERDMEELIARYPEEFFPAYRFTLAGRQGTFPGVGRYDLLLDDSRGMKILMELKARPAKYDDAEQLAKYNDALKLAGQKGIVLWLVATNIQHSVRETLDTIGIQYTEIHVAEYYRVAEKYGYEVTHEKKEEAGASAPGGSRRTKTPRPTAEGHTCSNVVPAFRERLAAMEELHPSGHRFLDDVGEDRIPDFRISTQKNAHLYYSKEQDDHNDFYAYVILRPEERSIDLISRPNANYWGKPVSKSGLLFGPPLNRLVDELGGRHNWAIPLPLGYTLTHRTPPEFFTGLLDVVRREHH